MRVAAATGLGLLLAIGFGCSHDAKPAVPPDDHPPLPEGTPIGYLIDDAGELQLRDDQVTRLKEIDTDLATRLDALDARQRGPSHAAQPAGGGRRRGGGRGGRGGGMRRGGAGGGSGSGSAASTPPASMAGAAGAAGATGAASGNTEERADDVREALQRAFAVLDAAQKPIARRVLSDHGVDLDAGRPEPGHSEAEPEPDEPETGTGSGSN